MLRLRAALGLGAGTAIAVAAGLAVFAQPPPANQAASAEPGPVAAPLAAPSNQAPPAPPPVVLNAPPANAAASTVATNGLAGAQAPPPPPPLPPKPLRSPAAILQALDKVTAETMRFAAPVGQRVRYKNLVFTVKACETTGLGQASPEASAYVVIESAPMGAPGVVAGPKEVFKGWMYANSPALHAFQHPIYDAWLIACMASAPHA